MRVADLLMAVVLTVVAVSTAVVGPGLLMETGTRLEDTLHRAVRVACARGPSAATTTEGRPGASHRVEAPASVADFMAAEGPTVAEADDGNWTRVVFPVVQRL